MTKKYPPASYQVVGKPVVCSHCGCNTFVKQRVLVRGPLSYCLVCTQCSLAMWFEAAPTRSGE